MLSRLAAVLALLVVLPAAAAPSGQQPLTQDDVKLYIDVMRAAVNYVSHAQGYDRAAIDCVKKSRNPQVEMPPQMDPAKMGTPEGMAAYQRAMDAYSKRLTEKTRLCARGVILSQYDEVIAKERKIQPRYDLIKRVILTITAANGYMLGCNPGDVCDPSAKRLTPAEKAILAKQIAIEEADRKLLQPFDKMIRDLMRALAAAAGQPK